ncbi:MAG: HisS family protein [Xanthobacteraceae bacterium]
MSKDSKSKIKPRLPRGLADRGPAELAATRAMLEKIRAVFERYGFEAVETPAIEYTEALGKFLPDQDRPNEGVFSFQDDDEQWLSLRYDLTAPLARYVAENFDRLPKPYRSYREGWVFRNEKPGPGRYRQFMQFDADTVGAASVAADAEMCMLAADTLEALGIKRGDYVIKVNNRKVLDGVMESIGLGGAENAGKRLTVLRAIDKLDRLGIGGVRALLGPGRKDESGDFTGGAGLSSEKIESLVWFAAPLHYQETKILPGSDTLMPVWRPVGQPRSHLSDDEIQYLEPDKNQRFEGGNVYLDNSALIKKWSNLLSNSRIGQEGLQELSAMSSLVRAAGYGSKRFQISSSVVRGLEYYTGPVYEAELTFEVKDEKGNPVRFGSVGGGGRYDGLVARFRGEPVPATGFSIGVSRLMAALQHLGKIDTKAEVGPVVVTVFDQGRIADYQKMVKQLRDAGIRAELYLGPGKMGPQLKYADKRNSPCVIIQGPDEKAKGEVQIKDLILGAKAAEEISSNKEWREGRPAQFSVPESEFVDAVHRVLLRHGIK